MRGLIFVVGGAIALAFIYAVIFDDRDSAAEDTREGVALTAVHGDRSEFSLRDGDLKIKASWRGGFKLDETGNAIAAVDDRLEIRVTEDGDSEEAVFEKDGRKLSVRYWRDGEEQPDGPKMREAVDQLTLRFLRASNFAAKDRIKRLLKAGGPEAVIDEIDHLTADHARASYIKTLAAMTELTPDELHALAETLQEIDSGANLTRALEAVLANQTIDAESADMLIEAASAADSDYDRRRLITAFIEHAPDAPVALLLDLAADIDSDYDLALVAERLNGKADLSKEAVSRLLALAAENMDSNHDLGKVLGLTASRIGEEGVADSWLAAFNELDADYDRRKALEAAAPYAGDDPALADRLRAAAGEIGSEFDREKALTALP